MPIWAVKLETEENPEFDFFLRKYRKSQHLTGMHNGEGHLAVTQMYTILN